LATPKTIDSSPLSILTAIHDRIKTLSHKEELAEHETSLHAKFMVVFEPLPHSAELPLQPRAQIHLKAPDHTIKTHNYPCPQKWKEAWHTLLQQHLDAGRIHPSSTAAGLGVFIILKADPTALPWWVNNYCQLNTNTIMDSFPIPQVVDILTDCATGTYLP
jgi:hypothetical protein